MKYIICTLMIFTAFSTHAKYYSQPGCMQDKWLNENVFKGKRDGVFVDLGAYDGATYSNTLFFEEELGWTGICVEPHPLLFEKLAKTRTCICIQGCVSNFNGQVDFLQIDDGPEKHVDGPKMLGGIYHNYDMRHIQRVFQEIEHDKGSQQLTKVNAYLLNDILTQHNLYHIDYLSIDTEGSEMDIIKAIDYDKFDIDIIDVEKNFNTNDFKDFFITKGFILIATLGHDEIYRNVKYIAQMAPTAQKIAKPTEKAEL